MVQILVIEDFQTQLLDYVIDVHIKKWIEKSEKQLKNYQTWFKINSGVIEIEKFNL